MLKRLLALALLAASLPVQAGRLLDLEIVDRATGQTLEAYRHRGRDWVAGDPGERYAVRLVNRTGQRVLVVLSVDGVNAVSGETAAPDQSGYVLEPWERAEIAGWRKSLKEIAQFYFTALPDSYAARTDRPDNVGVIGAAVFREKARLRPAAPYLSQSAPSAGNEGPFRRGGRRGRPGRRARRQGHARIGTPGYRPRRAGVRANPPYRVRAGGWRAGRGGQPALRQPRQPGGPGRDSGAAPVPAGNPGPSRGRSCRTRGGNAASTVMGRSRGRWPPGKGRSAADQARDHPAPPAARR
jgi:hypothetical protein